MDHPPLKRVLVRVVRFAGVGTLAACCWIALSAFAIQLEIARIGGLPPFRGYLDGFEELIGFSWGFAVAGAVGGAVAIGAFGRGRWGIVMGFLMLLGIGSISAMVVLGYPLLVARVGRPTTGIVWDQRRLESYVRIGSTLGGISGVVAAGLAVLSRGISRRMAGRWPRVLGPVALLAAVIPAIPAASSRISRLAGAMGLEDWGSDFRAIMGASAGSATGALAGLLVALLLALAFEPDDPRASRGRKRPRDEPEAPESTVRTKPPAEMAVPPGVGVGPGLPPNPSS